MKCNSVRVHVSLGLLLVFFWVNASAETSQATSNGSEKLWQQYLQSPDAWPKMAPFAEQDVAPLPQAAKINEDEVALGRALFHAKTLSRSRRISCANCHIADAGFGDPLAVSIGAKGREGKRNSPSLLNVDLWQTLFWDGRAQDLAEQAMEPLTHVDEMDSTPQIAQQAVKQNRQLLSLYKQAYGQENVRWDNMATALAAFQSTLRGPDTRFDHFYRAVADAKFEDARKLITTQELRGLHLYRTKAGCVNCHNGELFSDQKFHNTGLHYFGRKFEDLGRYELTGKNEDMGSFRTPMLRHVHQTNPWMHNGLFDSMLGIVRMYKHGGARPKRPQNLPEEQYFPETSEILQPFPLSKEEEEALLAFIKIL